MTRFAAAVQRHLKPAFGIDGTRPGGAAVGL